MKLGLFDSRNFPTSHETTGTTHNHFQLRLVSVTPTVHSGVSQKTNSNDPSAGSLIETLLRLSARHQSSQEPLAYFHDVKALQRQISTRSRSFRRYLQPIVRLRNTQEITLGCTNGYPTCLEQFTVVLVKLK